MASGLPAATGPLADEAARYKPRALAARGSIPAPGSVAPPGGGPSGLSAARSPLSSRPHTSAEPGTGLVQHGIRYAVPPLTLLALEALVAGFEKRPTLTGVPARYAEAAALKLSPHLDIRLTAPAIEHEAYWRRVCLEARGYDKVEVARYGGSWKRLCLERYVAELLEGFGMHVDLPAGYEDEFCRPPIDGTHPRWAALYPKAGAVRDDKRPRRERVAANAISKPRSDVALAMSGESGWPALERLKELARAGFQAYARDYAWASVVDKSPFAPTGAGAGDAGAGADGSAGGAGSAAAGGAGSGAAGGVGAPGKSDVHMLPFAVAAERLRAEEAAAAQLSDDTGDCAVEGNGGLREYVSPDAVEAFKKGGRWPAGKRGESILSIRQGELDELLARLAAAAPFVQALELEQFPSHLDLELLFARLPRLLRLSLTYGMRHLGMRFDRSLFGMRPTDADSLSRCLRYSCNLTELRLPCNMIDDDLVLVLAAGLQANGTITVLDLSRNNITSTGVQALARKLRAPCPLVRLDLGDNKIDERGGRYIGRALKANDGLKHLGLRLNELGDEGGRAVLEGARDSRSLASIDLAANKCVWCSGSCRALFLIISSSCCPHVCAPLRPSLSPVQTRLRIGRRIGFSSFDCRLLPY